MRSVKERPASGSVAAASTRASMERECYFTAAVFTNKLNHYRIVDGRFQGFADAKRLAFLAVGDDPVAVEALKATGLER